MSLKSGAKASARVRAAQRAVEILERVGQGEKPRLVALDLGISEGRVSQILKAELEAAARRRQDLGDSYLELQLDRVERVIRGTLPAAENGNEKAANAALRAIELHSKLAGIFMERRQAQAEIKLEAPQFTRQIEMIKVAIETGTLFQAVGIRPEEALRMLMPGGGDGGVDG